MSFEHPLALVLLVVPPILLWLRTRAARPRPAEASSLLVWQKVSPADTVPETPRPPLAAWIEAAGAALLAVGVAGPFLPGVRPADPVVLVDGSPSMQAAGPNGTPRIAVARSIPGAVRHFGHGDLWNANLAGLPWPGITSLLKAGERVVVVTDHRLPGTPEDGNRVAVVGVGVPGLNAGITSAFGEVLGEGRWRIHLVVELFGSPGPTAGRLLVGNDASTITLSPGRPLDLDREVVPGPSGSGVTVRIAFPGDVLADDDAVSFRRMGGGPVQVECGDADREGPLVRALAAAGAGLKVVPPAKSITLGGSWWQIRVEVPGKADGEEVRGDRVVAVGHALGRDVRVDPSTTLGKRGGPPPRGTPVLVDDKGPLVTLEEIQDIQSPISNSIVRFAFVPGGTWASRDPSFVVLARNLVELAAGGPPRIEVGSPEGAPEWSTPVLDAKETREAAEGETFGDLKAALEEARRPDPASRTSYAFALLMAGAVALGAAWLVMR